MCSSLLALFFVLFLATPKQAMALPGQHSIGLGAGQILLMSEYVKSYDNGIGFHALYEYDASALFSFSARLNYSLHKGIGTATIPANPADELSIKGLTPNLKVNFAYLDKLIVYGLAGFGIFLVDMIKTPQIGTAATFGFNLGTGFELPLFANFKFGSSLSFHNVFDKKDPLSVVGALPALGLGGTYMSLMLNALYVF